MVRDGVDYADSAPRRFVDEILRRAVGVCAAALFFYPASAGEHGEDFLPAYEGFLRPHVVLERHEFYEPQQKAVLLRKFKQPLHFSVVEAADEHRVELYVRKPRALRGPDSGVDALNVAYARDFAEFLRVERVEADVERVKPRPREPLRVFLKQRSVGREGSFYMRHLGMKALQKRHKPLAHERLAAREAEFSDAELREGSAQKGDVLVAQYVPVAEAFDALLRHAVGAAEVAAVRHRYADVVQPAPEAVDELA